MIKRIASLLRRIVGRITNYMTQILAGLGSLICSVAIGLGVAAVALNKLEGLVFGLILTLLIMGTGLVIIALVTEHKQQNKEDEINIDKFNILIEEIRGLRQDLSGGHNEQNNKPD